MCKQAKSAWCNVATLLKPVTNQLQDKHGSAGAGARRKRLVTAAAHAQCGSGERGCGAVRSACVHAERVAV